MAELSTLARPYARAAFDFAKDAGAVDQWLEYLAFSSSLLQDADFAEYLKHPDMTEEKQLDAMINVSNDSFAPYFKNFLSQLAQHDRLPLLPAISEEFELMKSAADNELKAQVQTAFDLSDDEKAMLEAALEKRYGNKVNMEVEVKPELIAGAVIRIGNHVIDDSAKDRLRKLKSTLVS